MTLAQANSFHCSIDLEAELRSITGRQHLNQVHYAVQLVRHALSLSPSRIDITFSGSKFTLEHDGAPLNSEEQRLLLLITTTTDDRERQDALSSLERHHGITLLSTLLNAAQCRIDGAVALSAKKGKVRPGTPSSRPGYRLIVAHQKRTNGREEKELAFYCRHASIPVVVNGRNLQSGRPGKPKAPTLQQSVVTCDFGSPRGRGKVGLPLHGRSKRVRFFKHGIYFGVRQGLPSDGLALEAFFDSKWNRFEENFTESIQVGNQAIQNARDGMLSDLPGLWPSLKPATKERLQSLLLQLRRNAWPAPALQIPLFGTQSTPWSLSLFALEAQAQRRGFISWVSPSNNIVDDTYVVLKPHQVTGLQELLQVPLRRARPFVPSLGPVRRLWNILTTRQSRNTNSVESKTLVLESERLEVTQLQPVLQNLFTSLEKKQQDVEFFAYQREFRKIETKGSRTRVWVPVSTTRTLELAERLQQDQKLLPLIVAALLCPL